MALHSLGKVTTNPGTLVRVTNNQSDSTARYAAQAVMIQALSTNTGKAYIGTSAMNKTTLVGVLAVLAIPSSSIIPAFSATIPYAPGGLNLADLWVDVDNGGEGVLVTAMVS